MFEKTALELRERSGFEALDSGLFLYRKYFLKIQAGVFPFFLPFIIAVGFVPKDFLWIPPLIIWLLTPLLGHLALRPLAHVFFQLPGKAPWKGVFRGALGNVTWRRFSPWRHYVLPVRVLEGLRSKRLRKRISHIRGGNLGTAFALNSVVFLSIFILIGGMITFILAMYNFIPFAFRRELNFQTPGVWHAVIIAYAVLVGLFEPAAAAMGFALYINRRVSLEGWDLEIAFSRWARRLSERSSGLLILLILLFAPLKPIGIEAAEETLPTAQRESLETVLSDTDFGVEREHTGLRWKTLPEKNDSIWNNLFNLPNWKKPSFAAETLRILVIVFIGAAVIFVIWRNRGSLSAAFRRQSPASNEKAPPEPLRPAPPKYNRENARVLWERGFIRDAWAMVYAGAIDTAKRNIRGALGDEATEGEWIRFLRLATEKSANVGKGLGKRHYKGLIKIINFWRVAAYAHRNPGEEAFHDALSVLDGCNDEPGQSSRDGNEATSGEAFKKTQGGPS